MSDVFSRLQERQQARLSALKEKKAQQQGERREEETPEYFTKQLEASKNGQLVSLWTMYCTAPRGLASAVATY